MIKLLLLYVLGFGITYLLCFTIRCLANSHKEEDKKTSMFYSALSWLGLIFIVLAAIWFFWNKMNNENEDLEK